MPDLKTFEYMAHAGKEIRRATIEAENERSVRALLREQGMVPIDIKVAKAPKAGEDRDETKRGAILSRGTTKSLSQDAKSTGGAGGPGGALGPAAPNAIIRAKSKTYFYTAIPGEGGPPVKGEIIAQTERDARQMLREQGLVPSKVEIKQLWHDLAMAGRVDTVADKRAKARAASNPNANTLSARIRRVLNRKIAAKDVLFYASQMCTMNEAGLSFAQTMDILSGLIQNPRLWVIHETVRTSVLEGASLAEAYARYENELPRIFIELITVGEASGNLEQTLKRLVEHLEKQGELTAKIKGALTYPIIMIVLIILIVIGLMIFVVPTFIQLFASFDVKLPPTTQMLIDTSKIITTKGYLIPLPFAAVYAAGKLIMGNRVGRQLFDLWEYKIPIYGKLVHKVTVSRILHNLALFLNCGISIINAIELTQQSITNAYTSLKLEGIRSGVAQGARLSTLFDGTGLFPPMVNYLLVAGEESGAIDELLEKGAKYVDKEVDGAVKAMMAAIEPLLTVLVAGVVLFVVGSLYLPLTQLMKGH
jgi:type IV pilus assembly protein PilC